MERYDFIDTDSHVIEPDNLWDEYLDPKFRADAPITRAGYRHDESGFGFFNDVTIGDYNQPIGFFGQTSVMSDLGEVYDEYARAGSPASTYLDAMDKAWIGLMVLNPTAGLYTNQAPNTRADVAAAYRRAYNDWLRDFCSDRSKRLIDAAGNECVVVAADFSHPEGRQYASASQDVMNLAGVSYDSKRKLVWDNALRLYPFDLD